MSKNDNLNFESFLKNQTKDGKIHVGPDKNGAIRFFYMTKNGVEENLDPKMTDAKDETPLLKFALLHPKLVVGFDHIHEAITMDMIDEVPTGAANAHIKTALDIALETGNMKVAGRILRIVKEKSKAPANYANITNISKIVDEKTNLMPKLINRDYFDSALKQDPKTKSFALDYDGVFELVEHTNSMVNGDIKRSVPDLASSFDPKLTKLEAALLENIRLQFNNYEEDIKFGIDFLEAPEDLSATDKILYKRAAAKYALELATRKSASKKFEYAVQNYDVKGQDSLVHIVLEDNTLSKSDVDNIARFLDDTKAWPAPNAKGETIIDVAVRNGHFELAQSMAEFYFRVTKKMPEMPKLCNEVSMKQMMQRFPQAMQVYQINNRRADLKGAVHFEDLGITGKESSVIDTYMTDRKGNNIVHLMMQRDSKNVDLNDVVARMDETQGAILRMQNADGKTPLDLAIETKNYKAQAKMLRVMEDRGVRPVELIAYCSKANVEKLYGNAKDQVGGKLINRDYFDAAIQVTKTASGEKNVNIDYLALLELNAILADKEISMGFFPDLDNVQTEILNKTSFLTRNVRKNYSLPVEFFSAPKGMNAKDGALVQRATLKVALNLLNGTCSQVFGDSIKRLSEAKLNAKGESPLHVILEDKTLSAKDSANIVNYLQQTKAWPAPNAKGETIIDVAVRNGHMDLAARLVVEFFKHPSIAGHTTTICNEKTMKLINAKFPELLENEQKRLRDNKAMKFGPDFLHLDDMYDVAKGVGEQAMTIQMSDLTGKISVSLQDKKGVFHRVDPLLTNKKGETLGHLILEQGLVKNSTDITNLIGLVSADPEKVPFMRNKNDETLVDVAMRKNDIPALRALLSFYAANDVGITLDPPKSICNSKNAAALSKDSMMLQHIFLHDIEAALGVTRDKSGKPGIKANFAVIAEIFQNSGTAKAIKAGAIEKIKDPLARALAQKYYDAYLTMDKKKPIDDRLFWDVPSYLNKDGEKLLSSPQLSAFMDFLGRERFSENNMDLVKTMRKPFEDKVPAITDKNYKHIEAFPRINADGTIDIVRVVENPKMLVNEHRMDNIVAKNVITPFTHDRNGNNIAHMMLGQQNMQFDAGLKKNVAKGISTEQVKALVKVTKNVPHLLTEKNAKGQTALDVAFENKQAPKGALLDAYFDAGINPVEHALPKTRAAIMALPGYAQKVQAMQAKSDKFIIDDLLKDPAYLQTVAGKDNKVTGLEVSLKDNIFFVFVAYKEKDTGYDDVEITAITLSPRAHDKNGNNVAQVMLLTGANGVEITRLAEFMAKPENQFLMTEKNKAGQTVLDVAVKRFETATKDDKVQFRVDLRVIFDAYTVRGLNPIEHMKPESLKVMMADPKFAQELKRIKDSKSEFTLDVAVKESKDGKIFLERSEVDKGLKVKSAQGIKVLPKYFDKEGVKNTINTHTSVDAKGNTIAHKYIVDNIVNEKDPELKARNIELLTCFLKENPELLTTQAKGMTILDMAIASKDVELIKAVGEVYKASKIAFQAGFINENSQAILEKNPKFYNILPDELNPKSEKMEVKTEFDTLGSKPTPIAAKPWHAPLTDIIKGIKVGEGAKNTGSVRE